MASGTYIFARKALAEGRINLANDTVRMLLYNTGSTIGTANPRGSSSSAGKGFNDSGVDTVSDFTTLGEYLPGDSSSADTRQTLTLTGSFDETNGRVLYAVSGAVSFGSLAAATLSSRGVLLFVRAASVKSTATFTFGNTEFNDVDNATLTLVDYAGKSVTYTISNDAEAVGASQFNSGANIAACTANFKIAVEHADTHNGTILVTDSGSGVVVLTQNVAGLSGNTTITPAADWNSICDVNPPAAFTGVGSTTDDTSLDIPLAVMAFPRDTNGNGSTFSVQATDANAVLSLPA